MAADSRAAGTAGASAASSSAARSAARAARSTGRTLPARTGTRTQRGTPPVPPRGTRPRSGLDTPLESRRRISAPQLDPEAFGRWSERFARFMGTASFLVGMTVFVALWLVWNTFAPGRFQFDPRTLNYTLLTLILSLQASYAAPLILLAQNRQDDRDRVSFEQDRQRAERALADTEFLAREVAALRIALRDVATRDFVRSELRALLEELNAESAVRVKVERKAARQAAKRAAKRAAQRTAARVEALQADEFGRATPAHPAQDGQVAQGAPGGQVAQS